MSDINNDNEWKIRCICENLYGKLNEELDYFDIRFYNQIRTIKENENIYNLFLLNDKLYVYAYKNNQYEIYEVLYDQKNIKFKKEDNNNILKEFEYKLYINFLILLNDYDLLFNFVNFINTKEFPFINQIMNDAHKMRKIIYNKDEKTNITTYNTFKNNKEFLNKVENEIKIPTDVKFNNKMEYIELNITNQRNQKEYNLIEKELISHEKLNSQFQLFINNKYIPIIKLNIEYKGEKYELMFIYKEVIPIETQEANLNSFQYLKYKKQYKKIINMIKKIYNKFIFSSLYLKYTNSKKEIFYYKIHNNYFFEKKKLSEKSTIINGIKKENKWNKIEDVDTLSIINDVYKKYENKILFDNDEVNYKLYTDYNKIIKKSYDRKDKKYIYDKSDIPNINTMKSLMDFYTIKKAINTKHNYSSIILFCDKKKHNFEISLNNNFSETFYINEKTENIMKYNRENKERKEATVEEISEIFNFILKENGITISMYINYIKGLNVYLNEMNKIIEDINKIINNKKIKERQKNYLIQYVKQIKDSIIVYKDYQETTLYFLQEILNKEKFNIYLIFNGDFIECIIKFNKNNKKAFLYFKIYPNKDIKNNNERKFLFEHKLNAIHVKKEENKLLFGSINLLNKNLELNIHSEINIDNIYYHDCSEDNLNCRKSGYFCYHKTVVNDIRETIFNFFYTKLTYDIINEEKNAVDILSWHEMEKIIENEIRNKTYTSYIKIE